MRWSSSNKVSESISTRPVELESEVMSSLQDDLITALSGGGIEERVDGER